MIKKIALIFLFTFILLPVVSAACSDISFAKSAYFPGETLQAEITGNFVKDLSTDNIFFYRQSSELPLVFNLEKISNSKFFVYVKAPKSYGLHSLAIKNVLCIENETLKDASTESKFTVKKPLAYAFDWLEKNAVWQQLNAKDTANAILAFPYGSFSGEGKTALLEKKTGDHWNDNNSVISTSLALIALNKLNYSASADWLVDAQNSAGKGLWTIVFEAGSNEDCSIIINEETKEISATAGENSFDIAMPEDSSINVSMNCSSASDARLTHVYKGIVNSFQLPAILNNEKCWGSGYKTACDALSTAHAVWALKELKNNDADLSTAINWLRKNAKTTEEKAFSYILSLNQADREWLLDNQAKEGYWSEQGLASSNKSSIEATVFALKVVNDADAILNGKSWLKSVYENNSQNSFGSFQDTELALQAFLLSEIEPILAITPGIAKTKTSLSIMLENNGILPMNVTVSALTSSASAIIGKNEFKILNISIPAQQSVTSANAKVTYSTVFSSAFSYNIPLILFPEKMQIGEITENYSLIPGNLAFVEKEINASFEAEGERNITIKLKNYASSEISDIAITSSWGLFEIKKFIEPSKIDSLGAGQEISVVLTIDASKTGNYYGTIEASSEGIVASIPVSISITGETSEKNCSELQGKICKIDESCDKSIIYASDGICCPGNCQKTTTSQKAKPNKWIGILMIFLAVAIVAFLVWKLKKKKKKPEMQDILQKIEEKYSKQTPGQAK